MNKKQREILVNNFNIYEEDNHIELEAWTSGGVDMFIDIDKNENVIKQLEDYIDNFDIDNEIELYREDKDYRANFTIRESLNDFDGWLEYIKSIIEQLKEVQNGNN